MPLEKTTVEGKEYYQWEINNEVGDLFTDWKEIPYFRHKLITQQAYSAKIKKELNAEKEKI